MCFQPPAYDASGGGAPAYSAGGGGGGAVVQASVVAAPPVVETVTIVIPPGVTAGQTLQVQSPTTGKTVNVQVRASQCAHFRGSIGFWALLSLLLLSPTLAGLLCLFADVLGGEFLGAAGRAAGAAAASANIMSDHFPRTYHISLPLIL